MGHTFKDDDAGKTEAVDEDEGMRRVREMTERGQLAGVLEISVFHGNYEDPNAGGLTVMNSGGTMDTSQTIRTFLLIEMALRNILPDLDDQGWADLEDSFPVKKH